MPDFVPDGVTAAQGIGTQGSDARKCVLPLGKQQLSTQKTALYYYDYVYIENIRRRQRTTGHAALAPLVPLGGGDRRRNAWQESVVNAEAADEKNRRL